MLDDDNPGRFAFWPFSDLTSFQDVAKTYITILVIVFGLGVAIGGIIIWLSKQKRLASRGVDIGSYLFSIVGFMSILGPIYATTYDLGEMHNRVENLKLLAENIASDLGLKQGDCFPGVPREKRPAGCKVIESNCSPLPLAA